MPKRNKEFVHPPYNKLKGFLRENNLVYDDLARLLGITASTVSQKINGKSDFFLNETNAIKHEYNVGDELFL